MPDYRLITTEQPAPGVNRITLNRPDKRNAIDNGMRGELLAELQRADSDAGVHVSIIRGAGECFSSGYDLKSDLLSNQPYFSPATGLPWARHVSEGWMSVWDLAKPVIAQVHGYAMAGGLELVGACDLAYATDDARLSHPVLRFVGLPDFAWFPAQMPARQAMELHLTGREFSGADAVAAGLVNQVFEANTLEAAVLDIAARMAATPIPVLTVNKRYVRAALEARGARSTVRLAPDLQSAQALAQVMPVDAETLRDKIKRANSEAGGEH